MVEATPPPSPPRIGRLLVGLAVSALVFLATVEGTFRAMNPVPRVQLVDLEARDITWVDGHPVWADGWEVPIPEDCPTEGGRSVLLLGDSIAVQGADAPDTIGPQLARRLQDVWGVPVCAKVAARPGMPVESQLALARAVDPDLEASVVVVLVWRASGSSIRTGRWWIETTPIATDADGWPFPPLPLPDALHRPLLDASAAWRYATLALAAQRETDIPSEQRTHREILDWATSHDTPVVFAQMVPLDQPFGTPWREDIWQKELGQALAGREGVVWFDAGDALAAAGVDVEAVRMDTCCHYLPPGHAAVADVLVPPVLAVTDPPPTSGGPSHAP